MPQRFGAGAGKAAGSVGAGPRACPVWFWVDTGVYPYKSLRDGLPCPVGTSDNSPVIYRGGGCGGGPLSHTGCYPVLVTYNPVGVWCGGRPALKGQYIPARCNTPGEVCSRQRVTLPTPPVCPCPYAPYAEAHTPPYAPAHTPGMPLRMFFFQACCESPPQPPQNFHPQYSAKVTKSRRSDASLAQGFRLV